MLLPKSYGIARAAFSSSLVIRTTRPYPLDPACTRIALRSSQPPTLTSVRHATHGAQGRVNGSKNSPGRRLGAKKTGDEYVIPGNIIFRQRGTLWFPGENVGMGRDHTIFALETGFVKYYRNPQLHPKRRYIGVVFDKTQTLPTPPNAVRRRRLNMVAVQRNDMNVGEEVEIRTEVPGRAGEEGMGGDMGMVGDVGASEEQLMVALSAVGGKGAMSKKEMKEVKRKKVQGRVPGSELLMRPGYGYRESNYQIGRTAERAGMQVTLFERGNRFLAWRKKNVRKAKNAEKRALGKKKGGQKKARKQ